MPWYRKLHWQILLGLALGLAFGLIASQSGWSAATKTWVKPFGTIFVNLLKMIAVPLVLASLITGVSSLSDLARLGRIGGKTVAIYLTTTVIAVTLGLVIVNLMRPGDTLSEDFKKDISEAFAEEASEKTDAAAKTEQAGPLQPLVDVFPANILHATTDNSNMLQVVFVAILFGIAMIQLGHDRSAPFRSFFEVLNELVIIIVNMIMKMAPIGVFALIASVITDLAKDDPERALDILGSLGFYCITVLIGLVIMTFGVYPAMLRLFTKVPFSTYFRALRPVQLLAFTSSSSAATLPLTMRQAEEGLGVSKEVTSFVLPLGATINMDGTALYQSVAAVFIAQALGMGLDLTQQLTIVVTATLASIGAAAVPSAGIIMLVIVLNQIGVPTQGIALILAVDRILDMCRTVTNVTGDTTVATIVAYSENELNPVDGASEAS